MSIEDIQKAYRMCWTKRRFGNQKEADRHGQRFGQRSYRCPECNCWHLTKQKNAETCDFMKRAT